MKKTQSAKTSVWRWLLTKLQEERKDDYSGSVSKDFKREAFWYTGKVGFFIFVTTMWNSQFLILEDAFAKPLEFRYIRFCIEGLKLCDM